MNCYGSTIVLHCANLLCVVRTVTDLLLLLYCYLTLCNPSPPSKLLWIYYWFTLCNPSPHGEMLWIYYWFTLCNPSPHGEMLWIYYWFTSGVGNLRPVGQLRPAELFHAARGLIARLCMAGPALAILIGNTISTR